LINWEYGRCPLNSDPEDFGPFQGLVSLWQQKRPHQGDFANSLPRRSDFDFLDFRGWWGKVAIVKFEENPFNVRFVLWGTDLTEWWGVDYTNKLLGEQSISPDLWKSVEGKYFEGMAAKPFIGLVKGYLDQHKRPHKRVVGVDLPLSDGQKVTRVILAHMELHDGTSFESLFPKNPVSSYF
jgi:hypothetical protein